MWTSLARFILAALMVLAMDRAGYAQSRTSETPPGISIAVDHKQIALPLAQGVPVLTPFIPDSNSANPQSGPKQQSAFQSAGAQSAGCASASSQPAPLVALASALKCDADVIYEYVFNNIEFEPLYGSNKGPLGTLLDRRGDDADQVILFVTLLNIAGYSQTGYVNGLLPLSGSQISNWLGVKNDATAIEQLLNAGGILWTNAMANADGTLASIQILHFQAALQLNGTWYYFDPSFKFHTILTGVPNLAMAALGYNKSQFLTDAGGSIDPSGISISNINRINLRADLVSYATNLVNYINQQNRTWSVGNVIGGKVIQPLHGSPFRVQQPSLTPSSTFPVNCPNQSPAPECRTFVTITMPGASAGQAIKLYTDQIYGHRITVFSTPSGANFVPTLLVDGIPPSCVSAGTCTNVGPATPAGQTWSIPVQVVEPNQPSLSACGTGITACKTLTVASGASYLISTGTGRVGRGMVDYHRQLLAQARAAGNADSSELVLGENLAVIGYGWLAEVSAVQQMLDQLTQVTMLYNFGVGITGQANIQQSGFQGPYVDLPLNIVPIIAQSSSGPTTTVGGISYPTAFVSAGAAVSATSSAFESAVLEQTQAPVAGMTAASTIKIIDANMNSVYPGALGKTFFADGTTAAGRSTYTGTILPAITPYYNSTDLPNVSNAVANGNQVLIPQNGKLAVGHWNGYGFTSILPQTGSIAYVQEISGGMSGGFSGTDDPDPAANTQVTLPPAANSDTSSPIIDTIPAPSNPQVAEPVDGITGAYVYKNTDLVTGSGKFPYALDFSRTYLSSSGSFLTTTTSDTGMGNGWAHNWSSNVQTQSDPYLGIGVPNSPAVSAATSIAALYVMQDLMSVTPTVQTLTVSSMVARWFTDQLTGNAAIVTQPDTTEEFIALPHPDGSTGIAYNAPPGSSARVTQAAAGQFSYMRKDGVTSNFGPSPAGALQSIVYPNGVTISLAYSGSPLQLSRVANNLGRSLNLTYSGSHISAVSDDPVRSVAYGYDGNNNLARVTNPVGATTTYAYDTTGTFDTLGHLTQVFYPSVPANAFVTNWYDALGRVVKQSNAAGAVSNLYFAGSRTELIDSLGNRHVTYQTDRGRVLSDAWVLSSSFGDVFNDTAQQNGAINVTLNGYDGLDRLTATVPPEKGALTYAYATNINPWANNISVVTRIPKPGFSGGTTTSLAYDVSYNKPTSVTDSLGLVSTMDYDPATGNLRSAISDVGGAGHFNATSRLTYNAVGQPVSAIDPMGTATQISYDGSGNQTSVIRDAGVGRLNRLTSFGYNARGDVISITDPNGNVTTNSYDAARRLTATTAPNGTMTTYSYDPNGQVIQVQQSANGTVLRSTGATYTLTGKPATATDANNNTTSFSYDRLDRVSGVTDALGRTTNYGYDALSRQISISNLAIQSAPLLQQSYTPDGLVAGLTDANSHATGFAYDGIDRLATTTYPLGSTETLTYDADSNVLTRKTRAGQTIGYAYDTLNRLMTKTPPSPAPVVSYRYDLNNRLTGLSDTSAAIAAAVPPSPATSVQYAMTYGYDALNRPTAVAWNPAPAATSPAPGSVVAFMHAYNQANQRSGQSVSDNSWFNYPAATPTVNYTADALNRYTAVGAVSPTYDGNSNLTFDGTFTFGYDAENRLTSASGAGNTAAYAYDAQGRRKTKTVNGATTVFVTDAGNREVLEYDGSSGAIQRWYAYGLGANEVLNQSNVVAGTRAALIPDIQGSVIASLDSGSGTFSKTGYLPYGKSGSAPATFGFTGQRIDPETNGLYYYRARHYSPAWGRFLQPDPIGYAGGVNLYAYTDNDPLNQTDPSGNCPACVAALAGALVGGGIDLGTQLLLNGGSLSQVNWTSVGVSALGGALLSGLGPTGFLLGRGGERAAAFGYSESAGLLNATETRFGWSFNGQYDVLSFRSGSTHFDIPGIAATAGANSIENGVYAGAVSGGVSTVLSSTPANGSDSTPANGNESGSAPPASPAENSGSTPTK